MDLFNKPTIAFLLLTISAGVAADSAPFNGTVRTEAPAVTVAKTDKPIAFVKEFSIKAEPNTDVCEISADEKYAQKGVNAAGKFICFFEWQPNEYGSVINKLEQSGVLKKTGHLNFAYKLYMFNRGEKHEVSQNSFAVFVEDPVAPKLIDYTIKWQKNKRALNSSTHWVYDRSESIILITPNVEARPYIQNVTINGKKCTVKVGETSCSIEEKTTFKDVSDIQGSLQYAGGVADTFGHFATEPSSNLTINWDFRPPQITAFHLNSSVSDVKTINFNGEDIAMPANSGMAIVASPHTDKAEEWWKPRSMSLKMTKSDGKAHVALEEIDGVKVKYNIPNIGYSSIYTNEPSSAPVIKDGYLYYMYDLSKVPDGRFDFSLKSADEFQNSSEYLANSVLFDRFGPDIQLLNNNKIVSSDGFDLYFSEALTIAASGGWDDGTFIKSVKWNGTNATLTGDSPRIKKPMHEVFSLNSALELEIAAEDAAGNETIKNFKINYMPVSFKLSDIPEKIHQSVETVRIRLIQDKGIKCKVSSSDEIAQARASGIYSGCTVEWENLPSGLESIIYPTSFALEGGINAVGEVGWGYKIYFHSKAGYKSLAHEGVAKINSVDAPAPVLSMLTMNKVADGVYGVAHNSKQITRYEIKTVPADTILQVTAANGEVNSQTLLRQRASATQYSIRNVIKRPANENRKAWDKTTYTVDAYHKRKPESSDSETFELITFPDGGIRANVEIDDTTYIDSESITANITIGKLRRGSYEYDIPSMGRWTGYIAIRANGGFQPISEKIPLDEEGKGSLSVNSADVFNRSNAIYAIVESINEDPEYQRKIVSNSAKMAIFQSEAVAGDLEARTTEGHIPFSVSMSFNFESKNDKSASLSLEWEQSGDQVNWTPMGLREGQKMYSVRVQEAGTTYYRVKMINKMTGEVSFTAPLRVIGYEAPDIRIEGPQNVYAGTTATLTVFSEEAEVETDGFTEWSTDNGSTWVSGNSIMEFKIDNTMKVMARFRLTSTSEEIKEEGYKTAYLQIRAIKPEPLIVSLSGPKHAEVGTVVELKGAARHRNNKLGDEIVSFWTTPSGEVIDGKNITYTIKEADIQDGEIGNFMFTAFSKDHEEATKTTSSISIPLWTYTMPEIKLALLSRIQIAPATIAARVDIPYFYAPGVELQYQWSLPEGVTIARETSSLTYLESETAGVKRIGILISDNRGNSKEVYEFIDIVQADPLAVGVEIKPSNAFGRVPLSYSVRTNAKPGHPNDSMKSYTWLLNGEELTGQTKPYANVEIQEPGEHQLTVKFMTEFGQEGELTETLTAVPNKPPVCQPFITETSSSITVNANCKDEDGKIISIKYSWREDGYESSGGTRLRFTKSLHDKLNISIRATDDSAEESISTIEWTNPSPKITTP